MLKRRNLKVLAAAIGVSVMSGLYASPVWADESLSTTRTDESNVRNIINVTSHDNIDIAVGQQKNNGSWNTESQHEQFVQISKDGVTVYGEGTLDNASKTIINGGSITTGTLTVGGVDVGATLENTKASIVATRSDLKDYTDLARKDLKDYTDLARKDLKDYTDLARKDLKDYTDLTADGLQTQIDATNGRTGGIERITDETNSTYIEEKVRIDSTGKVVVGTESGKQVVIEEGKVSGQSASFNDTVAAKSLVANEGITAAGGKFTVDGETGKTIVSDGQGKTTTIGAGSLGVKGATGSFNVADLNNGTKTVTTIYATNNSNEHTFVVDAETGNMMNKGSFSTGGDRFVVNGDGSFAVYDTDRADGSTGQDSRQHVFGVDSTTGNTYIGGEVKAKTYANQNNTFAVAENGNTEIGGTLDVTGATTLKSTLNVKDNADFDKNVNVDGRLDVADGASIKDGNGGILNVTGDGVGLHSDKNDTSTLSVTKNGVGLISDTAISMNAADAKMSLSADGIGMHEGKSAATVTDDGIGLTTEKTSVTVTDNGATFVAVDKGTTEYTNINGDEVTVTDGTNETIVNSTDVSITNPDPKNSERINLSDLGQIDNLDQELQARSEYVEEDRGTAVGAINAEAAIRREEVARLDNRIDKVEDRLDKVGAMTAAIANLRTMGYDPCAPSEFSMSLGHYRGETGMALGFFHYPNRDFMLSFSVSTAGDEYMGGIGATWKFGRKTPEQLAEEIKAKEVKKALAKAEAGRKAAVAAKVKVQQAKHAKMQ